jgi:hypothetical protein
VVLACASNVPSRTSPPCWAGTQAEVRVDELRERLAADLGDVTIPRVFAPGVGPTSTAARQPKLTAALAPLIDQAEEIIRELRRAVFAIKDLRRAGGLRELLNRLLPESERLLGFAPAMEIAGPVGDPADGGCGLRTRGLEPARAGRPARRNSGHRSCAWLVSLYMRAGSGKDKRLIISGQPADPVRR